MKHVKTTHVYIKKHFSHRLKSSANEQISAWNRGEVCLLSKEPAIQHTLKPARLRWIGNRPLTNSNICLDRQVQRSKE
jgi:hypothetical protein